MAFNFFTNAINSGAQQKPENMYHDLQQEFINMEWDNTCVKYEIEEQDFIGSETYHPIEAWMDSVVGDTTTGMKVSLDFCKLIFKDIDHRVIRGQMYKFDNNYWIINNYSQFSGAVQFCGVRRCNNRLKIIDPLNGKLQVIPCCVDYDMASPSQQISRYIITPNNHAVVIVQGNDLTLRLFKTNTRYILSGRPFKLLSYQNAIEYNEDNQQSTLLYLDLYLDEIHDKDDLENDIAENGEYNYSIIINSDNMNLTSGSIGKLEADIILNNVEVERNIIWSSSNQEAVIINEFGEYQVVGEIGDSTIISANIDGNENIKYSITINIVEEKIINPTLIFNPNFNKIRQYDTINFSLEIEYNGITYNEFDEEEISFDDIYQDYIQIIKNIDDSYSITALKIYNGIIPLTVKVIKEESNFNITKIFNIQIVSMLG